VWPTPFDTRCFRSLRFGSRSVKKGARSAPARPPTPGRGDRRALFACPLAFCNTCHRPGSHIPDHTSHSRAKSVSVEVHENYSAADRYIVFFCCIAGGPIEKN